MLALEEPEFDGDRPRPKTRADCAGVERPCPFVGCKHSLYLEVSPRNGSIKLRFPNLGPEEMAPDRSCVLDIAERGVATLQEVADALNNSRERVRQVQRSGCAKLARDTELGLPEGALRELLEGHIEDARGVCEPKGGPMAVYIPPMPIRPLFATPPERRTPVADEDEQSAEVGVDEAEEEIEPMPAELRERVVAILKERGPLAMRALAGEAGPAPTLSALPCGAFATKARST